MQTLSLNAFIAQTTARAAATGVAAIPTASLRNGGGRRTAAKREMLANIEARSKAAGLAPVTADY